MVGLEWKGLVGAAPIALPSRICQEVKTGRYTHELKSDGALGPLTIYRFNVTDPLLPVLSGVCEIRGSARPLSIIQNRLGKGGPSPNISQI